MTVKREPDLSEHAEDERPKDSHAPEQLHEYLHCWTLPGGTLAPEQARALLAWEETPDEERPRLRASLATMRQQVPATTLAPTQTRGHVSWGDRIRAFLRHYGVGAICVSPVSILPRQSLERVEIRKRGVKSYASACGVGTLRGALLKGPRGGTDT
jgi:hypothetical protein